MSSSVLSPADIGNWKSGLITGKENPIGGRLLCDYTIPYVHLRTFPQMGASSERPSTPLPLKR